MGGGGLSGLGVGVGNLGTYGRGGGKGGRGWGQGRLKGKRKQSVDVSTGPPLIFGSLDKEIIRRVINNNRSRIKYCYEKELNKYPKLQGKIKVFFQIEGNGMVSTSSVKETTMNNERVEECLAQRVKNMRFPAPKGGGIVQVNYPFFFKPS
ncbi:AgmX/PglI C-terminal domain-containing protein [Myxococcota bacterium]|nr:AgmX/PglI C-terminal domain-containing protein [Myxococcota bacterium]